MEVDLYNTRVQMQALVMGEKPLYEWGNILDRLMINLYNQVPDAVEKARSECKEKAINPEVVDRVESLLREQLARTYGAKRITSKVLPDERTRDMYKFLQNRFPLKDKPPAEREDLLTRCVLRYASLGQGGQQWALNRAMMARIQKQGVGASPFNNYFKLYFSIFKSDAPFGSLGSFFSADPKLLASGLYANPPFTAATLEGMSERLSQVVETYPRAKFVLITPTWTDAPWYARLQRSFQATLKKDTLYFSMGAEFTPKFTTTLWTRNVDVEKIL
jgi:hypothetical protein